MSILKDKLYGEIEEFRETGKEFLKGNLNVMQYKHASGGFGVYAQKGGKDFMIRLRIPSGVGTLRMMNDMHNILIKYNVKNIHLTTRQAIQIHNISIDDVCDIMKDSLDKDIYTRGAGGNFPRNVAMSPLSGVSKDDIFDVKPYALETGNYFMERITEYKLPRKLKVSYSNSMEDTAHCTVQDLGFVATVENGKKKFKLYIGGGLGQNPRKAVLYPELVEANDILFYVEATVKLFMAEGDYNNRNKARIRYIVDRLGESEFIESYKRFIKEAFDDSKLKLSFNENIEAIEESIENECSKNGIIEQKQKGLYSVYCHPIGGQLPLKHLKEILDLNLDEKVEFRLSMTEGFYLINLDLENAKKVLDIVDDVIGKNCIEKSVACIGVPTCQVGLCNSQGLLNDIIKVLKEKGYNSNKLPQVNISGCGNSCGVHQIGKIGFTGKKKRVNDEIQECFTLFVNGNCTVDNTHLGESFGELLKDQIPEFLYELSEIMEKANCTFEELVENKRELFIDLINKYKV